MALILDFLIIAVVLAFTSVLYQRLAGITQSLLRSAIGIQWVNTLNYDVIALIVAGVIYTLYFTFFWGLMGKTPGGIVLGLRIIDARGKRPSYLRAFWRFLVEFVGPLFLVFGGLWILIHPQRRAWWDILAGTYVVYDWEARPEEKFLLLVKKSIDETETIYPPEQ